MHVSDGAAWATIAGVVIAVAVPFTVGFFTARGTNQRTLRERLRQQLREMRLACHMYLQKEGWDKVNRQPAFSFQELDQIWEDGLISPKRGHLEWLKSILREVVGRPEVKLPPREILGAEEYDRLTKVNERRLHRAVEILDEDSQAYLCALGRMDNAGLAGYFTYLRYRLLPPRQRNTFPTDRGE